MKQTHSDFSFHSLSDGRVGILIYQDLHTNQLDKVILDSLDSINCCFVMVTIGTGTNIKILIVK